MKRDFTRIFDVTADEYAYLLERAAFMKGMRQARGEYTPLRGKSLGKNVQRDVMDVDWIPHPVAKGVKHGIENVTEEFLLYDVLTGPDVTGQMDHETRWEGLHSRLQCYRDSRGFK